MKCIKRVTNGYSSKAPEATFSIEMDFNSSDPLAVRFTFSSDESGDGRVEWEFGRELLAASLKASAGSGDIVITPSADTLSILLRSPFGSIIIEMDLADVTEFVADTNEIVPIGSESDAVTRELDLFLARAAGDSEDDNR